MSPSKHFLVQIRLIVFTVSLSYLNTTVNRRLCEGFFSLSGFAVRGIETFPSEFSLSVFAFGTREQSFAALALRDAFNIRHHPPFVLEHCLQSGLWTIMSYKKILFRRHLPAGIYVKVFSFFVRCTQSIAARLNGSEEYSDLAR